MLYVVDGAATLRSARLQAGLTQAQLAARAGTSQATLSAYESGSKQPTLATFSRLLRAAGARLSVEQEPPQRIEPSRRAGKRLVQVLQLAEALPVRHERTLRYPRLDRAA
jgi:transcriptional regulator with XRE-family HTH domain